MLILANGMLSLRNEFFNPSIKFKYLQEESKGEKLMTKKKIYKNKFLLSQTHVILRSFILSSDAKIELPEVDIMLMTERNKGYGTWQNYYKR